MTEKWISPEDVILLDTHAEALEGNPIISHISLGKETVQYVR
jgi:hypothetical protein